MLGKNQGCSRSLDFFVLLSNCPLRPPCLALDFHWLVGSCRRSCDAIHFCDPSPLRCTRDLLPMPFQGRFPGPSNFIGPSVLRSVSACFLLVIALRRFSYQPALESGFSGRLTHTVRVHYDEVCCSLDLLISGILAWLLLADVVPILSCSRAPFHGPCCHTGYF